MLLNNQFAIASSLALNIFNALNSNRPEVALAYIRNAVTDGILDEVLETADQAGRKLSEDERFNELRRLNPGAFVLLRAEAGEPAATLKFSQS
jgi:hypothetical protein